MLKVIKSLYLTLKTSDPGQYKSDINVKRIVLFISGYILSGVSKAPECGRPNSEVSEESHVSKIDEVKQL